MNVALKMMLVGMLTLAAACGPLPDDTPHKITLAEAIQIGEQEAKRRDVTYVKSEILVLWRPSRWQVIFPPPGLPFFAGSFEVILSPNGEVLSTQSSR